jgi:uncharacterized protein YbcI
MGFCQRLAIAASLYVQIVRLHHLMAKRTVRAFKFSQLIGMKTVFTHSQHLEQALAEKTATSYQMLIGHQPRLVSCHRLAHGQLTIVLEGAVTKMEKLLLEHGSHDLARSVRLRLNTILRPRFAAEVEAIFSQKVADVLCSTKFETDRMSVIVILSAL